ncbi:MAG: beta-lactamase family protein [Anaerolineae bacterium]|nr:beta-lactamase family protein [Anaerolineae bacterium]MDW8171998.1 serine hydrolase domain-containing protein [Anaerolineae bacterium]
MTRKLVTALALLICLVAGRALPSSAQADVAALDAYFRAQIGAQRVPGIALALAYADGRVDVRTYGGGIAPQTRFRIGSLSKAMTAVAVLQLTEQGLINLDAPLQTYLPDFTTQNPDWAARITVRHLLNHTSGLSELRYDATQDKRLGDNLVTSFASAQHDAEPGEQFAYFNANYELLGRIVEVVSGQPYNAYMRERVFAPAGMDDALAYGDPTPIAELAQGHLVFYGFPVAFQEPLPIPEASGGIIASGADMAAFLRQFLIDEPNILSKASIAAMLTAPLGVDSPYGMGWIIETTTDNARIYTHGGGVMTFSSDMALLPDEGVAFALLYNRNNLLSTLTTNANIHNSVIAILRDRETPVGGVSENVVGVVILVISATIVISDTRRLLTSRRWTERTRNQPLWKRALSLVLLLFPVYFLLALPSMVRMVMQRVATYELIFFQLPDLVLLLFISAALSLLTLVVRLIFWRSQTQRTAS